MTSTSPFFFPPPADSLCAAYGPLVHAARNNRDEALCIRLLRPLPRLARPLVRPLLRLFSRSLAQRING